MTGLRSLTLAALCGTCCNLRLVADKEGNYGLAAPEGLSDDNSADRHANLAEEYRDSLALLSHVQAGKVKKLRRARAPGKVFHEEAEKMVFVTHHKMGTVLASDLLFKHLAPALDDTCTDGNCKVDRRYEGWWAKYGFRHSPNLTNQVCFYEDPLPWFFDKMLANYPDLRIVNFIRDPLSEVVSGLQYHRRQRLLINGGDSIPGASPHVFRQLHNLTDQIKLELRAELRHKTPKYLPPLLRVQENYRQLEGNENVLTVRFEDFVENFDETTRRIFTHVLGVGHPKIESLVLAAQDEDVSRWEENRTTTEFEAKHLSDKTEKVGIYDELRKMHDQQEDLVMELYEVRSALGY